MKKKYTLEFKQEAAKLVTEHGYSQAEASRRLGVSDRNINRWVLNNTRPKHIEKPLSSEQQELQQLRKEVIKLRLEREILKKAAAFFASEQK
jgi:transposase